VSSGKRKSGSGVEYYYEGQMKGSCGGVVGGVYQPDGYSEVIHSGVTSKR
jgi:hypothetical protein